MCRKCWNKYENMKTNKHIMSVLNKVKRNPNTVEIHLQKILNEILPNIYKYVGDNSLIIGYKNPDFVNIYNNKLIEMFGTYWHRNDYPEKRIEMFEKYGYKTLIIWENELDPKLKNYDKNKSICENILDNKIYKIYDCGNMKFEKTFGINI